MSLRVLIRYEKLQCYFIERMCSKMGGAWSTRCSVTWITGFSMGNKTALYPGNVTLPHCAAFNTMCKDTSIRNDSKNVSCIYI